GAFHLAVIWLAGLMPREAFFSLSRRFSAVAVASLAILVPTGLFGAWLYIPSPASTADSPYGVVLFVKLAFVAVMVALGVLNWRAGQRPEARQPRLSRTLTTEALFGAAVLAAVALLVNLAPPQGQSPARQAPAS